MSTTAIQVRGLSKKFGHFLALDQLSFDVAQGGIHGFLGPNGSGKSTAIRTLIGVLTPTAGQVEVLGQNPIKNPRVLRQVGYVPGDVALWDNLSGGEVLRAMESLRGIKNDPAREAELIEAFELDPTKKLRAYSTGNRRKVSIIAAMAHRPELLILDEPTAGLDPLMEQIFMREVRQARNDGATVFLSSHILSEVEALCDYVTVLKEGRAVASNEVTYLRQISAHHISATIESVPPELLQEPKVEFGKGHLLITTEAKKVPAILRVIIDNGGQDIVSTPASLEEIFFKNFGK
ncbi:ABC transporter ATP-binding protein [Corynebacterium callunae]|uniref:ABC transporter ATP-binding protein n=1 Tax=Corynebacterium callunae TaxID=1721 RepID=UPI0039821C8C